MVVKFDPGFAQYTTILSINTQYIYASILKFKNFSQRKTQFKMYYNKIIKITENNVAFCLGCLLWATYLKSLKSEEIINNPCFGDNYNEQEAVEEIDFSINFFEQLKKDVKYYLGQSYEPDERFITILNTYREFFTLNEGFVNTKLTDDIKLPPSIKSVSNYGEIKDKIDEVIKDGELMKLFDIYEKIL